MRKIWKIALAVTVVLGLWGAAAQAQPIISGNTAAFGCGPILTSDLSLGTVTHSFFPDGAGCGNTPPNDKHNGRGLAIGGTEVFYTELDEIPGVGVEMGFGASEFIHVATFNAGDGSGDVRLLPNPRPGSGIQDLTFANGTLYVLTGYDTQVPIVYKVNFLTGDKLAPTDGIEIERVGFPDQMDYSPDGFAVLPNGNFLVNNKGTQCIYAEYDKDDGHFIGNIINVPGGPARCTGVDTDGTSLYFLTDPTISAGITRTDFAGNMNGFNFFDGPGSEVAVEDISIVHPVTFVTQGGDGHFWFSRISSDDNSVKFDLQAEVLKGDEVIASGIRRCVFLPNQGSPLDFIIPLSLTGGDVVLQSGDVISARLSTRDGTNNDDTLCKPSPLRAIGIRFYYDSVANTSQFPLTISPATTGTKFYFHSDGTNCKSGGTVAETGPPPTDLNRNLSDLAPTTANTKCKHSDALTGAAGNPWVYFNEPTNTVGSVPALWKRNPQP
jgi:hypothetical protein